MVVRGSFGDQGRPLVDGTIYLLRLGIAGSVRFLVDTAANISLLSFADAIRLGVNYARFNNRRAERVAGTGGVGGAYLEKATVLLRDPDGVLDAFRISIGVAQRAPDQPEALSILGRDVLNGVRLVVHKERGERTLER